MCPLSNCTSLPLKINIFEFLSEQLKPLNNSSARACIPEHTAASVREDVQSLHAGLPGISALCGVPSVTRWCQHPEISGRLGQEEVGAALLREGDVWNSCSTIHSPKKGLFSFFFLSFLMVLSLFSFFLLCCLRKSQKSVIWGSRWGQQIQMMLDADMEAAVALGALTEHHSC